MGYSKNCLIKLPAALATALRPDVILLDEDKSIEFQFMYGVSLVNEVHFSKLKVLTECT